MTLVEIKRFCSGVCICFYTVTLSSRSHASLFVCRLKLNPLFLVINLDEPGEDLFLLSSIIDF